MWSLITCWNAHLISNHVLLHFSELPIRCSMMYAARLLQPHAEARGSYVPPTLGSLCQSLHAANHRVMYRSAAHEKVQVLLQVQMLEASPPQGVSPSPVSIPTTPAATCLTDSTDCCTNLLLMFAAVSVNLHLQDDYWCKVYAVLSSAIIAAMCTHVYLPLVQWCTIVWYKVSC